MAKYTPAWYKRLYANSAPMYEALKEVYGHLKTGYIANDCVAADRMRQKLENKIEVVLAAIDKGDEMIFKIGQRVKVKTPYTLDKNGEIIDIEVKYIVRHDNGLVFIYNEEAIDKE